MQIILLEENRFDEYAINHPNYNIYQSSNYGRLMTKKGYNAYYLGLVDDSNKRPNKTICCVLDEPTNVSQHSLNRQEFKHLNQVGKLCERNGAKYFTSLEEVYTLFVLYVLPFKFINSAYCPEGNEALNTLFNVLLSFSLYVKEKILPVSFMKYNFISSVS